MAMDSEDSFFSRWSRRKVQARVDTPEPAVMQPPAPMLVPATPAAVPAEPAAAAPEAPPLPTLADVAELTTASDFSPFVARGVTPEVKNAALKKLFTDPHFNVMDGLDTYIDDYGKPDPLPAGMLRQMVQSQLLGLFDDEEDEEEKKKKLTTPVTPPPPDLPADENTDLQLQPDDDAGRPGPAPGAGQDAGRQH
jgi:hypothetical protein